MKAVDLWPFKVEEVEERRREEGRVRRRSGRRYTANVELQYFLFPVPLKLL